MENLVVHAQLSTSDGNGKFQDKTKTVYLVPASEKESLKLRDFGLTEYNSEETGVPFYIMKLVQKPVLYNKQHSSGIEVPELSSLEERNWETKKSVPVNIIKAKSEEYGTDFYRLQAINIDLEEISYFKPQNPFIEE